jgi:hypothetical protein
MRDEYPELSGSFAEACRTADAKVHRSNGSFHDAPYDGAPPVTGPEDYGGRPLDAGPDVAQVPPPFETPVLSVADWLDRNLREPDYVLGHWLTTTTRALIVAPTGLGKTNFGMALGMHMAAAVDFLGWRGRRKCRVLYIDGEMSRRLLKQRITDAVRRLGHRPETFFALSHEDIPNFQPLNTPGGQAQIERIMRDLGGVDFIIFDSVMCLTSGDKKEEESWSQVMPWVRGLTKRNIGQSWIHHTGHDETRSYGTKTREWQLDTVVHLEGVKREDTDVSFNLVFKKARERTPANRHEFQDIEIALVDDTWIFKGEAVTRPSSLAPMAQKFLDALRNALAGEGLGTIRGRKAASTDQWKRECTLLGLLDPEKAHSSRTLFSKYRRELVAANAIGCEDDWSWAL